MFILPQNVFAYDLVDRAASEDGPIYEMTRKETEKIDYYKEKYGKEYWLGAYILAKVQMGSIPISCIGLIIGGTFRFVLGNKRRDFEEHGFDIFLAAMAFFTIAMMLPFLYALTVSMMK